jgi:hypothetical protein
MAADPASDKIIAMTLDESSDINAVVWSGSGWGEVTEFETGAPSHDGRNFDVAFEPAGTRALAMYGRGVQSAASYRTYDGTSWSPAAAGPGLSGPPGVIQLSPIASGQGILIGVERKNDGALCFMRWDGSSLVDDQVLAPDLGGPNGNECFMFTDTAAATTHRVLSWQEVDPG